MHIFLCASHFLKIVKKWVLLLFTIFGTIDQHELFWKHNHFQIYENFTHLKKEETIIVKRNKNPEYNRTKSVLETLKKISVKIQKTTFAT